MCKAENLCARVCDISPLNRIFFCLMSLGPLQNFWNLHYAGIYNESFSQKSNACLPPSLVVGVIRAQREEKLFWGHHVSLCQQWNSSMVYSAQMSHHSRHRRVGWESKLLQTLWYGQWRSKACMCRNTFWVSR